MTERIYLDNAATSWPKPEAVYLAVERYQRELGAPVGRSAYAEAGQVQQGVAAARKAVAKLIGCGDPRRVIFTFNGTDSLNQAIGGVLRDGDHIITTVAEHNSVLRPLRKLEDEGRIEVTRVGCNAQGVIDAGAIADALRDQTRLIAMTHASNVTGAIQPAQQVGALAREHECLFLLDAAQSLGDVQIDVQALQVDLLAAPGHKGLLGPLGTGVLYVRPGVEEQMQSTRQGGTGTVSELDRQPETLPDKYESGNHNAPGILGLGAGVEYLLERGVSDVRQHTVELTTVLLDGLRQVDQLLLHGPGDAGQQVGVVSFTLPDYDPQEVAGMLDSAFRIQVRAGLHCAPEMHRALGTLEHGGTVRLSLGPFTTVEEIEITIQAIRQLAGTSMHA